MENVTLDRDQFLRIVKENREKHAAIAQEAREGYRAKLLDKLMELTRKANDDPYDKILNLNVNLPAPQDHTKEYDIVIRMLELSVDTEIEIGQYEFSQYILDEWSWKQGFLTTNSVYAASLSNT